MAVILPLPWPTPTLACLTFRVQAAHDRVYSAILAQIMVIGLQKEFYKKVNVERNMVEVVNSPTNSSALESWKPRPRKLAKKASAPIPPIESSSSDAESELINGSDTESDASPEDVIGPQQVLTLCSYSF
jgi:hypothetical protein